MRGLVRGQVRGQEKGEAVDGKCGVENLSTVTSKEAIIQNTLREAIAPGNPCPMEFDRACDGAGRPRGRIGYRIYRWTYE